MEYWDLRCVTSCVAAQKPMSWPRRLHLPPLLLRKGWHDSRSLSRSQGSSAAIYCQERDWTSEVQFVMLGLSGDFCLVRWQWKILNFFAEFFHRKIPFHSGFLIVVRQLASCDDETQTSFRKTLAKTRNHKMMHTWAWVKFGYPGTPWQLEISNHVDVSWYVLILQVAGCLPLPQFQTRDDHVCPPCTVLHVRLNNFFAFRGSFWKVMPSSSRAPVWPNVPGSC